MAETTINSPRLQVDDPLGRRVVVIDKPVFRIGRKSESDLRSLGTDVSREHAEIVRLDDGRFMLRDRGSRCGTFVNDEQVTERPLRHRDKIRLGRSGSAELVFLADDGGESRSSSMSGIVDFRPLTTLLDRLRGLGSARVLDEVLVIVMDSAIDATGAERGFIMLANAKGELEFKIARARGKVTLSGQSFATSQKIPQEVFATGHERIVADLMDGNLAGQHLGTVALGIRHVLCTPLRVVRYLEHSEASADQRPIGVLYLDSREKGQLMSALRAHRAGGRCGRGRIGDRKRAALSRGNREGAAGARAGARGGDSARAAPRGAAIGRALRSRRCVDSVPRDRRRFLRLLQPARRPFRVRARRRRRQGTAGGAADGDDSRRVRLTGHVSRIAGGLDGACQPNAHPPRDPIEVRHGDVRNALTGWTPDLQQRRTQSAGVDWTQGCAATRDRRPDPRPLPSGDV